MQLNAPLSAVLHAMWLLAAVVVDCNAYANTPPKIQFETEFRSNKKTRQIGFYNRF
jgi:hypothetical protein